MRNQIRTLTLVVMMVVGCVNLASAEESLGSLEDGEKAFFLGEYGKAEKIFSQLKQILN